MPRGPIPDALKMRTLKYGEGTDAERDAVAEALRAAGRRAEALLLFEGRPDHPGLAAEIDWAAGRGAGFHLMAIRRLGREVPEADLRACARAAEGAGRWLDARLVYQALGDDAALRRIAEHLPEGLRPEAAVETPEPDA